MKSKTVFYNKGILRSDFRRLWWVPALMTLLMFIDQPLHLLNTLEDIARPYGQTQLYDSLGVVHYVYPIIASALLFRYLHTTKSSQFFHTLPVTRGELLRTKLIALWSFVLIPILVNWGAVVMIYHTTIVGKYFELSQINAFYGGILCANLALCGFAVFSATITGNTAGMIGATILFPLIPYILFYFTQWGVEAILKGFAGFPLTIENFCESLIPLPESLTYHHFWYRLAEFVLLHGIGFVFYHRYSVERAGDLITVGWMRPIFLFGVCYCSTILGATYADANQYSAIPFIVSVALATAIGFYIAEALLQKTLRIWSSWKKFAGYAVVISILIGVIQLDPMGFQAKVPEVNEVEQVMVSYVPYPEHRLNNSYRGNYAILKDPKNIEKVVSLHKEVVQGEEEERIYFAHQYFIYTLKDGSQIKRQYDFKSEQLYKIFNTEEYKMQTNELFLLTGKEDIHSIILTQPNQPSVTIENPETIQQLIEIGKEDVLQQDMSAEETISIEIRILDPIIQEIRTHAYFSITDATGVKEFLKEYQS